MGSFPQLSTGAISQYPLTKTIVTRTVINSLEDGSTIRLADPVSQVKWDLSYTGLSQSEWTALSAFFSAMQGGAQTFTFADPTGNLLPWSEDFSQTVWTKDPLIVVAAGIADPMQGTSASSVTNTAQIAQGIVQQIPAPGSYNYCFSVYLRCAQACSVSLRCIANSIEQDSPNLVNSDWTRYTQSVALSSPVNGVTFGLLLPAGIALDVYGMQVEAQPAAGTYKKTSEQGGVYLNSRFAQDQLPFSVDAPDIYSTKVSIVTVVTAT
jgi:hypothetical protein